MAAIKLNPSDSFTANSSEKEHQPIGFCFVCLRFRRKIGPIGRARNPKRIIEGETSCEVFWQARKIDKNVQINGGRGSGTTGCCHLAFLYKFPLGLSAPSWLAPSLSHDFQWHFLSHSKPLALLRSCWAGIFASRFHDICTLFIPHV